MQNHSNDSLQSQEKTERTYLLTENITRLSELGISLVYLRPHAKIPFAKEWQTLPFESAEEFIKRGQSGPFPFHELNLGIRTGINAKSPTPLICIDLDSEEALELGKGLFPETPLRVKTARGEHWYYRDSSRDSAQRMNMHFAEIGIDIKGDGGQCVSPPSIHPSGHLYSFLHPLASFSLKKIPAYSPSWLTKIPKQEPVKAPHSEPIIKEEDRILQRALAYLEKLPAAISGQSGHQSLWMATLTLIRGFSLSKGQAKDLLLTHYNPRCSPEWSEREIEHKIEQAVTATVPDGYLIKQKVISDENKKGPIASPWKEKKEGEEATEKIEQPFSVIQKDQGILQIASMLQCHPSWQGILRYNEFYDSMEFVRKPPWHAEYSNQNEEELIGSVKDVDALRLMAWCEKELGTKISKQKSYDALALAAAASPYHPIRDYLTSLSWDGVKRLPSWLTVLCQAEDTKYNSSVGMWWMISAVARILVPGCIARSLLVLEGKQQSGKSTLCKILGGPWYKDTGIRIGEKDALSALRGTWIYELAEIDYLSKYEASSIKSYISSTIDSYRPAYGRFEQQFKRQCVFIGTTNKHKSAYLADETGGTRFWPVSTGNIDIAEIKKLREQLFAEAVHRFRCGEKWWASTHEEEVMCAEEQDQRFQEDPWEMKIQDFLHTDNSIKQNKISLGLTMDLIAEEALGLTTRELTRGAITRIGHVLLRLGFEKKRRRKGAGREFIYLNAQMFPHHARL